MSDRDRPIRKDTGIDLTLQHVALRGGKLVHWSLWFILSIWHF